MKQHSPTQNNRGDDMSLIYALILITNKTIDKKSSHNPYTQDYAQFFV